MTLVMDGVVRRGVVQPLPMVKPTVRRAAEAVLPGNVRYITGLDGIRRPVPLTPREMLANMVPQIVAPAPAMLAERVEARSWQRPAIAFGLVAVALAVSGAATLRLTHPTVAARTTTRTTPAKAVTQAAAPAIAAVAPTPDPAIAARAAQEAALGSLLATVAGASGDQWGIVVTDLKTGATSTLNADRSIESASLYKLFVAQQIYHGIDTGQFTYSQAAGGGTGRSIQGCLTVMINISDNACGHALGQLIGWADKNAALKADGFTGTNLAGPYQQTSAHDVALLFQRLYNNSLVSPNSNDNFLGLLKQQRVNNRLPQGLPAGTVIAHKTGDLDGYLHDAGIVYGPKTDYIVVMTGKPGVTPSQFSALSSKLWSFFQQ